MDSSYITSNGMARMICEKISGGVKMAESKNIITMAYLRLRCNVVRFISPQRTESIRNIGDRKHIPNAFSNDVVRFMYSVILAWSSKGWVRPAVPKFMKNSNALGRTMV